MWEYYKQFMDLVHENQVVVLVGETGSGKTTQVCVCVWVGGSVGMLEKERYPHICMFPWTFICTLLSLLPFVDSPVVDRAPWIQEEGGLHTAKESGSYERSPEGSGRDGCHTGTGGWVHHTF